MAAQLVNAELADRRPVSKAVDELPATYSSNPTDGSNRITAARGLVTAMMISMPFWALIAFTIYLLS